MYLSKDIIYLTTIGGKSALVKVREVNDGGMVEFDDAVTGKFRGCAGIHWFKEPGHCIEYTGELPKIPDSEKWILVNG